MVRANLITTLNIIFKTSITLFVLFIFSCSWAADQVKEKRESKKFHKRLLWLEGRPRGCAKEYFINNHNRDTINERFHFSVSQSACTLYFDFADDFEIGETYKLRKVILTSKEVNFEAEYNLPLRFSNIGWGYRIDWQFEHQNQKYAFRLYMRPGYYNDPFLIK